MDFVMRFFVLGAACFQFLYPLSAASCHCSVSIGGPALASVRNEWVYETAISFQNPVSEEDLGSIEGRFIDKRGEPVDGRQMSSWIEIMNLSTGGIGRAKVDELGNFRIQDLSAGNYRIWVRRKSRDSCGVRKKSWKVELKPHAVTRFVGTIEWMKTACILE